VNKLFAMGRATEPATARAALIRQATEAMVSNPPWLVIGLYRWVIAHGPNVGGITWAPYEGLKFPEIKKSDQEELGDAPQTSARLEQAA
jgi:hypothetical protein